MIFIYKNHKNIISRETIFNMDKYKKSDEYNVIDHIKKYENKKEEEKINRKIKSELCCK